MCLTVLQNTNSDRFFSVVSLNARAISAQWRPSCRPGESGLSERKSIHQPPWSGPLSWRRWANISDVLKFSPENAWETWRGCSVRSVTIGDFSLYGQLLFRMWMTACFTTPGSCMRYPQSWLYGHHHIHGEEWFLWTGILDDSCIRHLRVRASNLLQNSFRSVSWCHEDIFLCMGSTWLGMGRPHHFNDLYSGVESIGNWVKTSRKHMVSEMLQLNVPCVKLRWKDSPWLHGQVVYIH